MKRGDIIQARSLELTVLELTETGYSTRIGEISKREPITLLRSGRSFDAQERVTEENDMAAKAKGKTKATKAPKAKGAERAKSSKGNSLSEEVYQMLGADRSDEAIYAFTEKEFPDAAFNEKRYLPWYKQNLKKLIDEGKRDKRGQKIAKKGSAAKPAPKAKAPKTKAASKKKTTSKKKAPKRKAA